MRAKGVVVLIDRSPFCFLGINVINLSGFLVLLIPMRRMGTRWQMLS